MLVIPIYDMILLPNITFYFKKEFFEGVAQEDIASGKDIVFLMQKEGKERSELAAEDFYPVGVSGRVEKPDEEGNISIHVTDRVRVSGITVSEEGISASVETLEETADLAESEEKERFDRPWSNRS